MPNVTGQQSPLDTFGHDDQIKTGKIQAHHKESNESILVITRLAHPDTEQLGYPSNSVIPVLGSYF